MKNTYKPVRGRGRPRGFDREAALEKAVQFFWEQGYEGTSIADLTAAMGITAPSLYSAFGSKEELYREALVLYREGPGAAMTRALKEESTAFAALSRLLRESASDFSSPGQPRGCMISTAVLGCAPENRDAAKLVAELRSRALAALKRRLDEAVKTGELPRETDTSALARFYGAIVQGLSVQARDRASKAALNGIVEYAIRAWPGR